MQNMSSKVENKGQSLFDVWMKQESRLVQDIALVYGEIVCMQQLIEVTNKSTTALK
jgi:hypothetical protein